MTYKKLFKSNELNVIQYLHDLSGISLPELDLDKNTPSVFDPFESEEGFDTADNAPDLNIDGVTLGELILKSINDVRLMNGRDL